MLHIKRAILKKIVKKKKKIFIIIINEGTTKLNNI